MAQLASKGKLVKKWWTIFKIGIGATYCYTLVPITPQFQSYFGYLNIYSYCEKNSPDCPVYPFFTIIGLLLLFYNLGQGIYFNLMMYFFVKKINPIQAKETYLIPWKSNNQNQENDLQIPTRATIIMSIIFIVVSAIAYIFLYLIYANETDPQLFTWPILLSNTIITFVPIILITFSVKQQSKLQNSQPPTGLQFHETDNPKIFVISPPVHKAVLNDNDIELQSL